MGFIGDQSLLDRFEGMGGIENLKYYTQSD